jgi:multisubunit Na+/H+ antiporter MnhC subunit
MKLLYYRIYYTIYRSLIWVGQSHETDMIRVNVFILMSIYTMLIGVGIIGFLIGITGELFIVNFKIQGVIFSIFNLGVNAYIIFYGKRYNEIESELSATWAKNKSKNILLTLAFIVCSVATICFSLMYIKEHPLRK